MSTEFENVSIVKFPNDKIDITIDISNADIGAHYIPGTIVDIWNKNFKSKSVSLTEFISSIHALYIINVDAFYKRCVPGSLKRFHEFLDEFIRFKNDYNIRYGEVYSHGRMDYKGGSLFRNTLTDNSSNNSDDEE